ncbi:Uma2 family endonuclease [Anaerobacillus alkaliphilus]|uniref:Uma2 family endonuclease n=1 Tax=Anaerobacillus alkaliphilus TaxID=1548597 RepID=A0A4Q0VLL8_9BACI|nr:Uma2 family endonuclease [Anaerobacillus alkaliphilus]RXI96268.1 Uma2 family endonuclease [Anaerobacillus alkaliphilus]
MGMPEGKKYYTYSDFLEIEEEFLCEVIDGTVISMSPSPTPKHQDVVDELTAEFKIYLRGKDCMAYSSPIDVCLFADKETNTEDIKDWVQPDLMVVCDKNKVGEKYIIGAPDLVIEVLSPSTARNDRLVKYNSYEKAGVKEYWIVDPYNMSVEIYSLDGKTYKQLGVFGKDDLLTVDTFKDMQIDLKNIFKA